MGSPLQVPQVKDNEERGLGQQAVQGAIGRRRERDWGPAGLLAQEGPTQQPWSEQERGLGRPQG
jgi:hypothetical protein